MVQYGQIGRKHAEVAFAGPIWEDVVEFRIAGVYDKHDGFIRNTTADVNPDAQRELRGYDHKGYRAKLKFPDIFGTDLKLSYESVDLNNTGAGVELWHIFQPVQTVIRKYDPHADVTLNNYVNSEDGPDFRFAHTNTARRPSGTSRLADGPSPRSADTRSSARHWAWMWISRQFRA